MRVTVSDVVSPSYFPLTTAVAAAVSVPVIASGGAGNAQHMAEAFGAGAEAALIASASLSGE